MVYEPKTKPDYYEGTLSPESKRERVDVEETLDNLYEELRNCENTIIRVKLLRKIDSLEATLSLQGANPKHLDFEQLKEHIRLPNSMFPGADKYKASIKNRTTAIRAFCMNCQGADIVGVRECPSVTCPLHPFRMGKDPLRGWDIPKAEEPDIDEDEEDIGEFEEGDDDAD